MKKAKISGKYLGFEEMSDRQNKRSSKVKTVHLFKHHINHGKHTGKARCFCQCQAPEDYHTDNLYETNCLTCLNEFLGVVTTCIQRVAFSYEMGRVPEDGGGSVAASQEDFDRLR